MQSVDYIVIVLYVLGIVVAGMLDKQQREIGSKTFTQPYVIPIIFCD